MNTPPFAFGPKLPEAKASKPHRLTLPNSRKRAEEKLLADIRAAQPSKPKRLRRKK